MKDLMKAGSIPVTSASSLEDFTARLQEADDKIRAEPEDGEADAPPREEESKLAKIDAGFKCGWAIHGGSELGRC